MGTTSSPQFILNLISGFICICIFHINCISARGKSGRDCKVGLSSDGQCYYPQPRPSFFDERILMRIIDFHCVFVFVFHFCLLHRSGVSILMSYGENPSYVKLPIFSEFMENSTKIYEKLRSDQMDPKSALWGPKPISRTGVHCLKIEATHQINVFISVFCCIGDHIWQKHCLSFINT